MVDIASSWYSIVNEFIIIHMGLLSEFTDFINEAREIGGEVRDTVKETANTLASAKDEAETTVKDTANELKNTSSDINNTVKESVDLNQPSDEE